MSTKERIKQACRDVAERFGDAVELDEAGQAVFELDDDRECLIGLAENGEALALCVNVAPVLLDDRQALFRHLLVMNFEDAATRGAALGLTPEDEIVLRLTRPADALDAEALERLIGNLAVLARDLGSELMAWQRQAEPETATPPKPGPDPSDGRSTIHPDYA